MPIEMKCGRIEIVSPHPTLGSITTSSLSFTGADLKTYTDLSNASQNTLFDTRKALGGYTGTLTNTYYVVGVNQFTGQEYTEAWDGSTDATVFGSDWEEGYYRIFVKWIGTINGEFISINLEKLPLFWNKSFIAWMTWVPAGSFWQGSPADEPGHQTNETLHRSTLTDGFYIARTECTVAMYNYIMDGTTNGTTMTPKNSVAFSYYDYRGMRYVSNAWHYKDDAGVTVPDATASSVFLYKSEGKNSDGTVVDTTHDGVFEKLNTNHAVQKTVGESQVTLLWRPPYEAEWEYACRAGVNESLTDGKKLTYLGEGFDAVLNRLAWYKGNCSAPQAVAQKLPNLLGLYDMLGNVWEWNYDAQIGYTSAAITNPFGAITNNFSRSKRGGSFYDAASYGRCARRSNNYVSAAYYYCGFRLALALI